MLVIFYINISDSCLTFLEDLQNKAHFSTLTRYFIYYKISTFVISKQKQSRDASRKIV